MLTFFQSEKSVKGANNSNLNILVGENNFEKYLKIGEDYAIIYTSYVLEVYLWNGLHYKS